MTERFYSVGVVAHRVGYDADALNRLNAEEQVEHAKDALRARSGQGDAE